MSADNWAVCPRCRAADLADGPYPSPPTFREDYEFSGAETGTLQIAYSGQCSQCGLSFEIREEHEFWKPGQVDVVA